MLFQTFSAQPLFVRGYFIDELKGGEEHVTSTQKHSEIYH